MVGLAKTADSGPADHRFRSSLNSALMLTMSGQCLASCWPVGVAGTLIRSAFDPKQTLANQKMMTYADRQRGI